MSSESRITTSQTPLRPHIQAINPPCPLDSSEFANKPPPPCHTIQRKKFSLPPPLLPTPTTLSQEKGSAAGDSPAKGNPERIALYLVSPSRSMLLLPQSQICWWKGHTRPSDSCCLLIACQQPTTTTTLHSFTDTAVYETRAFDSIYT